MARNRRNKSDNVSKKNILASAEISSPTDTDILNEDLFNEAILDTHKRSSDLVKNRWVLMFNQNQSFLKGLMALLNNSVTLKNVNASKTAFIMGEGFAAVETDSTPFLQSVKKLVKFFRGDDDRLKELNDSLISVNIHGETLEEVLQKGVSDYEGFGNSFFELVRTSSGGQPTVLINHVPVYKCGVEKVSENGKSENVAICENWKDLGNRPENLTILPIYPEFKEINGTERSIIHIKKYAAGFDYWGLPDWIASRFWAEIECRCAKYNITKFKNGFVPSAIIQAFGAMTEEEAQDMIKGIDRTFSDTGKNSKIFMQVLRDPEHKINVEVLEDKSEGTFLDLLKSAAQSIVTGSRWTPSLAGISTAGKLGSNQQIRDEIEFVTNTVVKPSRRVFLHRVINPFVNELSKAKGGIFDGLALDILNLTPVSVAGMLDPNTVLLTSEKRAVLGFENLDPAGELKLEKEQGNNMLPKKPVE